MWSIVIFDIKSNNLIFSRDIFGEKPLYFSSIKKKTLFSDQK